MPQADDVMIVNEAACPWLPQSCSSAVAPRSAAASLNAASRRISGLQQLPASSC